jgi:hypothetical protein
MSPIRQRSAPPPQLARPVRCSGCGTWVDIDWNAHDDENDPRAFWCPTCCPMCTAERAR